MVLFEPERSEYRLFFSNIFSFSRAREVCEIAYPATRRDLWRRRAHARCRCSRRHGLRLRMDVLQDQERDIWEGMGLPRGSGSDAAGVTSGSPGRWTGWRAVPQRGRRRAGPARVRRSV